MPNMSYCRFHNTVADLRDCYDHMDQDPEELEESERLARKRLIAMCASITRDFGEEEN